MVPSRCLTGSMELLTFVAAIGATPLNLTGCMWVIEIPPLIVQIALGIKGLPSRSVDRKSVKYVETHYRYKGH